MFENKYASAVSSMVLLASWKSATCCNRYLL